MTDTLPLKSAPFHVRASRARPPFRHNVVTRTIDAMETAT